MKCLAIYRFKKQNDYVLTTFQFPLYLATCFSLLAAPCSRYGHLAMIFLKVSNVSICNVVLSIFMRSALISRPFQTLTKLSKFW